MCSIKKVLLKILQNFQEKHLCQSLFFNKVTKETLAQCFPVNFAKFLRTSIFIEHLLWLLLNILKAVQTNSQTGIFDRQNIVNVSLSSLILQCKIYHNNWFFSQQIQKNYLTRELGFSIFVFFIYIKRTSFYIFI